MFPEYINEYGSNSKFPSTGPGFRVWVQVPDYGSRFLSMGPLLGIYLGPGSQLGPSIGPGSQVWVQVLEYGSRLPNTGPGLKNPFV